MKLSEAIILGDTMKKCDPGEWISDDGFCGCALGGALLATGVTAAEFCDQTQKANRWTFQMFKEEVSSTTFRELPCIAARWPWLTAEHIRQISDLYYDVADHLKTIEDVVVYVRSIEPAEESNLPDISLAEQYRAEEEAAAEEGALIEVSGYNDPATNPRFA